MPYLCPAKVNLALSVGSPTADGYHPIASWMVAISLYDSLTITPLGSADRSTFDIDWADDAMRPTPIDWPLEKDLVYKAHKLVEQHVGRLLPIAMTLRKRIPVGGGLAGGSSNGAAMLTALNQLFDLQLSGQALIDLSMQLGSDLAFFLGESSAIVSGRGEIVTPTPRQCPIHLALALPPFGCPTGQVYQAFDQLSPDTVAEMDRVQELVALEPLPVDGPFNDLAAPACQVQSALSQLQQQCSQTIGQPMHITGSGAGMFTVAKDAEQAERLAKRLNEITQLATCAVVTL